MKLSFLTDKGLVLRALGLTIFIVFVFFLTINNDVLAAVSYQNECTPGSCYCKMGGGDGGCCDCKRCWSLTGCCCKCVPNENCVGSTCLVFWEDSCWEPFGSKRCCSINYEVDTVSLTCTDGQCAKGFENISSCTPSTSIDDPCGCRDSSCSTSCAGGTCSCPANSDDTAWVDINDNNNVDLGDVCGCASEYNGKICSKDGDSTADGVCAGSVCCTPPNCPYDDICYEEGALITVGNREHECEAGSFGLAPIRFKNPLEGQTFEEIFGKIVDLIFKIVILLVPLMIVIAAFLIVTAGGNLEKINLAKKIIIGTIIGFLIVLLAKGIIALIEFLIFGI